MGVFTCIAGILVRGYPLALRFGQKMTKEIKSEVRYKVSEHFYVPAHELVPKDEVDAILKKYSASPAQLPRIRESDSVVKELGGKPGDLVKIARRSETAGETSYYRYVVEG